MRLVLAVLAALSLSTAGCAIVSGHGPSRSAVASKKCPPGHVWSDGACHGSGKGHDR